MPSVGRRVLSSTNFLATLALLFVLFIMVNFIASRRYARHDFSRQQVTTLSEQTRRALESLTEPVSVIVFYQPASRLYELIHDLLEEYARRSPTVQVEYVDPQQDIARARQLVKEFDLKDRDDLDLVVVRAGSRHKHLSDAELAEYDYGAMQLGGEPRVKAFKGEDAFTSAIISVTRSAAPTIWFTSGHGEKALEDDEPGGLSDLKQALTRQDITVETVTLLERAEIPADARLIVIAGPTHRFTEPEVGLLQTYLERGGKVLALLDPLEDTGLEPWLAKWGLVVGQDIVVDPARQLPFVSAANLFVTEYTLHPLVEKMKTLATLFPLARSVRPAQTIPEGVTVSPLALTSAAGWGETQTSVSKFEFNEGQDLKGPVSIAVAAERTIAAQGDTPSTKARLVVIGDSDFAIDAQLPNVGNRDFLLGAVYWLTEQEQLIGIGPRPLNAVKLNLTGGQLTGVFWFSFLAMPLACGMLGALMWWTRRT
jgi:ABC-type uncharacterized transport system involved in gliding motility auxiliary subunit